MLPAGAPCRGGEESGTCSAAAASPAPRGRQAVDSGIRSLSGYCMQIISSSPQGGCRAFYKLPAVEGQSSCQAPGDPPSSPVVSSRWVP